MQAELDATEHEAERRRRARPLGLPEAAGQDGHQRTRSEFACNSRTGRPETGRLEPAVADRGVALEVVEDVCPGPGQAGSGIE